MKITCSVQARLGSTRLPGKVLYPLADKRIIEWVAKRSYISNVIDETYVAIGDRPENEALIELCARKDMAYKQGPEDNLVERHKGVIDETDCDILCRITGDCPFVPTGEITRVVQAHIGNNAQYTTNKGEKMPIGIAVDVFDIEVIEKLYFQGEVHPVKPLREDASEWNISYTIDNKWKEFSDAHTAVDTPRDYWRLIDAVSAVGTDPSEVTQWVSVKSQS